MSDDITYRRITNTVLYFKDGYYAYDFPAKDYLILGMHLHHIRFKYEHAVELLHKLFHQVVATLKADKKRPQWVSRSEPKVDLLKSVIENFGDRGNFCQWRKIAFYEHKIAQEVLRAITAEPYLCKQPDVVRAHDEWQAWREMHPHFVMRAPTPTPIAAAENEKPTEIPQDEKEPAAN